MLRDHSPFRLAQREAAIVTPVPGTTRDILELSLDIGGLPVIISDTAGLRATTDLVESIGIERARNAYGLPSFTLVLGLQNKQCSKRRYIPLCTLTIRCGF